MANKREVNYVKGAFIITLGMLLSKFLGLFFKIPLTNLLGDYGMGLYSYAYPLYTTFLTISTGGLPLAVSKLVAESVALGNRRQAYKIHHVAICALAIIGGLCSLIMFAGARFFITAFSWEPEAYYSIIAISFAPIMVATLSVIRGFFQGMQSMSYSSVSTIIEQLGRVGAGLYLAYFLTSERGVAWGAAGGTFGAVAGAFLSLAYLYFSYVIYRKKDNQKDMFLSAKDKLTVKDILKDLIRIALPVTVSSVATTLTNLIDSVTITANLALAGFSSYQATELFGQLTNKAQTLLNVPLVVGAALATSLVPSMSESIIKGDMKSARRKSSMAVRLSFLLAVPAALGLALLSAPIYELIYPKAPQGSDMLAYSAMTVVFTVAMSTLHGILQGAGKYYLPIRNIVIGGLVKFFLNMVLVRTANINIYGAIISSTCSTGIIFLLGFIDVWRYVGYNNILVPVFKGIMCSLFMGVICLGSYNLLSPLISVSYALVASIFLSVVAYTVAVFATKTFSMSDLKSVRS